MMPCRPRCGYQSASLSSWCPSPGKVPSSSAHVKA
ncbi:hypothetical protein PspLS_02566 [Pyricularia sp. CBS 133598]|nr:hypothetical protein PspLS_02566 [Pyricularia sp. CBS 133598]